MEEQRVSILEGQESTETEVSGVLGRLSALNEAEKLAVTVAIHAEQLAKERTATVAVQVSCVAMGSRVVSELLLVESSAPMLVKEALLAMARKASPALWSEILSVLGPADE